MKPGLRRDIEPAPDRSQGPIVGLGPDMVAAGLDRLDEVVGVGVTRIDDDHGLNMKLREQLAADSQLPRKVNGVPVKVEVIGAIRTR